MMDTMTDEILMEKLSMIPTAEEAEEAERWKDEILSEHDCMDDLIGVIRSKNF